MPGMKTASEPLSSDPEKLLSMVVGLQAKLAQKDAQISHLTEQYQQILEQFRLGQQRQFGRSSEAGADQLGLFNEGEQITESADDVFFGTHTNGTKLSGNIQQYQQLRHPGLDPGSM